MKGQVEFCISLATVLATMRLSLNVHVASFLFIALANATIAAAGIDTCVGLSSLVISGTGKFAGTQCSGEDTSSSSDGVHFYWPWRDGLHQIAVD